MTVTQARRDSDCVNSESQCTGRRGDSDSDAAPQPRPDLTVTVTVRSLTGGHESESEPDSESALSLTPDSEITGTRLGSRSQPRRAGPPRACWH